MIRSYRKLQGTRIQALDGELGKLKDIFFDDRSWRVRYLVIELGPWSQGDDVLVPPSTIGHFNGASLRVELTKAELKTCSSAYQAIPVALQQQFRARSLYNLVCSAGNVINGGPMVVSTSSVETKDITGEDPHLRSCAAISRYELVATDGDIGSIGDLLIDDSPWLIRFIVGAVSHSCERPRERFFGPHVVESIEWSLSVVNMAITRQQALSRPYFDPGHHLDTSYEAIIREMVGSPLEPKRLTGCL